MTGAHLLLLFAVLVGLMALFRKRLGAWLPEKPAVQPYVDGDGKRWEMLTPTRREYGAANVPAGGADLAGHATHCGTEGGCTH